RVYSKLGVTSRGQLRLSFGGRRGLVTGKSFDVCGAPASALPSLIVHNEEPGMNNVTEIMTIEPRGRPRARGRGRSPPQDRARSSRRHAVAARLACGHPPGN